MTSYRLFQKTQLFWSWNLKLHLLTYYKDNWFHPTILKIFEVKKIAYVRNPLYFCVCVHVCVYCICCVRVGVWVHVFDYTGLGCIRLRSCVRNCRMWVCMRVCVWGEWSCDDILQRILVMFLIYSEQVILKMLDLNMIIMINIFRCKAFLYLALYYSMLNLFIFKPLVNTFVHHRNIFCSINIW